MCIVTCRTLREPAAGSVQRGRGPRAHRDGSVYGPCSGGSHSVVPAPKPAQVQGSATRAPSVHREEERADVPLRGEAREGACPSAGRRPGLAHTAPQWRVIAPQAQRPNLGNGHSISPLPGMLS